ncbi:linearmycin/streptolysin S transport system ATP-binding protein [Staphylococcus pasteuri]|uniref:ABC-2 type transport system ATP-binding protein n=3 Tax=Staphylococcus TaxID=1279 RepID=A0ABY1H3X5_9STAP|nr:MULTISPECIES: ABC transporter ATP-binding protein [Staphylococcus]KKI55609.1 ABC transporter ATP-binding protein [Staphylococcus pasteuri]MCF7599770.1 ABC transporter ATP-binding protein [Staphylococcus pasteuri]MDI3232224.1 ABC transporter ATP-binding protein [Staphylococcus pasteuri]MDO6572889.1 ABC transporter ATP-binding protein [Staphylococcus pasteuri_A]MEB6209374.1 ABC transporter ATP-binding protein [Staphylococcus pasteuri]
MININDVSKSYRNKHIFDKLNMQIQDNQITILLGENGAGKSTLLRLIAGIEKVDSGSIQYFNQTLTKRHIRDMVGYVPQDIALFEHMTVNENINFFKSLCNNPVSEETIQDYLSQLNFKETKVKVSNLSGGNKRKINILIGLLSNPHILILDEPTVGINLESRYDIHRLLEQLKSHCLIIMTTHHLDEVEVLADEIKLIGQNPFYQEMLEDKHWHYEKYNNALT